MQVLIYTIGLIAIILLIYYFVILVILVILAIPLGSYIGKVMNGEKVFLSKLLSPCEN